MTSAISGMPSQNAVAVAIAVAVAYPRGVVRKECTKTVHIPTEERSYLASWVDTQVLAVIFAFFLLYLFSPSNKIR